MCGDRYARRGWEGGTKQDGISRVARRVIERREGSVDWRDGEQSRRGQSRQGSAGDGISRRIGQARWRNGTTARQVPGIELPFAVNCLASPSDLELEQAPIEKGISSPGELLP